MKQKELNDEFVVRPYADLTAEIWRFHSLDELIAALPELDRRCNAYITAYRRYWRGIDLGHFESLGYSIEIERYDGGLLNVGISESGWLIDRIFPKPIIGHADLNVACLSERKIAIVLPEWTEYDLSSLCSKDVALDIIQCWLTHQLNPFD